jgi:Protein of unknown function (DUF2800)
MSEHSPLGASSAERWMSCPGSNVILNTLNLPPSEETDFAKEGTAAHTAAAHCLRNGLDAWEIEGQKFDGYVVDAEMRDSLQLYFDTLAEVRAEHGKVYKELVEYRISGDFHPLFFGTCDDAISGEEILDITDFKYGAGIAVDAFQNAQLMYYAVGILDKFLGPTRVRLRIVQPRAFHVDGPVRVWETTTEAILEWKTTKLIPAMNRAEIDTTLTPGDHCRFCPAKLACPLLTSIFGASITADASALVNFSSASLARDYSLLDASKHYWNAVEREVLRRLNRGEPVTDGTTERTFKLVPKRANRVLTTEGEAKAAEVFTHEELFVTEMKSPAQLDKLGNKGKEFTKEYAYTPQTGLTVAPADDPRVGVKVTPPQEAFAAYLGGENGPVQ